MINAKEPVHIMGSGMAAVCDKRKRFNYKKDLEEYELHSVWWLLDGGSVALSRTMYLTDVDKATWCKTCVSMLDADCEYVR